MHNLHINRTAYVPYHYKFYNFLFPLCLNIHTTTYQNHFCISYHYFIFVEIYVYGIVLSYQSEYDKVMQTLIMTLLNIKNLLWLKRIYAACVGIVYSFILNC